VLPVDSLLIVAEDARRQLDGADGFETWVAMDARMDEVYAAAYRWADGRWHGLVAPALYDLDTLHARWQDAAPGTIAGSALGAFGPRLRAGDARTVPQVQDRGGSLLRLAQALWDDGGAVDAQQALPLYLRDKVALTTAEREEAAR
jgi:tRNA threonylcarbamoyladenosine biosynthesis protein TsaB